MILASMITHTSVTDYLTMTLSKFYTVLEAIARVMNKRKGE